MVVQRAGILLALAVSLAGLSPAWSAVTSVEDLAGCKLQNGRVVLPAEGTSGASNGPLYKFSTNQFSSATAGAGGTAPSPEEMIARLQESKAADIEYRPGKGGSLWAFSGAITEVPGMLYLSDVSGQKLVEPWPLPKTTQNLAGECTQVHEGAVYLLKTTDGRFVLLRLLEKTDTAAIIQYVYQPDGTSIFTIPVNAPVKYVRPVDADPSPATAPALTAAPSVVPSLAPATPATPTTPAAPQDATSLLGPPRLTAAPTLSASTRPLLGPGDINENGVIRLISGAQGNPTAGLEPSIDTFAHQRTQLLQRRIDTIYAPARTPAEIDRKAQAIADLAELRPDEPQVLDLLVAQISFFNPRSSNRDVSPDAVYPCFTTLKHLGKAATTACLKGLKATDFDAPGEGIDSAMYKAKLLGMVVRSVEGDSVAEFMFKQEADRATDPKQRAVFEFLLAK